MIFKTATPEHRCESATGLVDALGRDGIAAAAAERVGLVTRLVGRASDRTL